MADEGEVLTAEAVTEAAQAQAQAEVAKEKAEEAKDEAAKALRRVEEELSSLRMHAEHDAQRFEEVNRRLGELEALVAALMAVVAEEEEELEELEEEEEDKPVTLPEKNREEATHWTRRRR